MPDSRRIHISLRHFRGLGSHIYVTIRPEHGAAGSQGESERVMKFTRRATARRWVDHVLRTEFDSEVEVLWDSTETYEWFYPEGD
ncbi:MAG: hypothetical protein ACOCYB_00390 [Alkalispirochaeta sp.]